MQIGDYIKRLRAERGWSLADLSERCGVSKGLLSTLENGLTDPQLATLQHIAKAFDLGAGDLLVCAGYTVQPIKAERYYTLTIRPDGSIAMTGPYNPSTNEFKLKHQTADGSDL